MITKETANTIMEQLTHNKKPVAMARMMFAKAIIIRDDHLEIQLCRNSCGANVCEIRIINDEYTLTFKKYSKLGKLINYSSPPKKVTVLDACDFNLRTIFQSHTGLITNIFK
jgi:hypothetical protein